jgi:hypothetical protein
VLPFGNQHSPFRYTRQQVLSVISDARIQGRGRNGNGGEDEGKDECRRKRTIVEEKLGDENTAGDKEVALVAKDNADEVEAVVVDDYNGD